MCDLEQSEIILDSSGLVDGNEFYCYDDENNEYFIEIEEEVIENYEYEPENSKFSFINLLI